MRVIGIGDTVYYSRIHQETGICELCELKVRTVYPDSFVGVDQESRIAFIISYEECDIHVFDNRETALAIVKEAEKKKKKFTTENSDDTE